MGGMHSSNSDLHPKFITIAGGGGALESGVTEVTAPPEAILFGDIGGLLKGVSGFTFSNEEDVRVETVPGQVAVMGGNVGFSHDINGNQVLTAESTQVSIFDSGFGGFQASMQANSFSVSGGGNGAAITLIHDPDTGAGTQIEITDFNGNQMILGNTSIGGVNTLQEVTFGSTLDLAANVTAPRTWDMPDKDGTVAMLSDTGVSVGDTIGGAAETGVFYHAAGQLQQNVPGLVYDGSNLLEVGEQTGEAQVRVRSGAANDGSVVFYQAGNPEASIQMVDDLGTEGLAIVIGTGGPSISIYDAAGKINMTRALQIDSQSDGAAVSDAGSARIRYNSTTNKLEISENGGAYVNIV